jgi:hypothetical protein
MSLVTSRHKELNKKFIEACFDGLHNDVDRLLSEGAMMEAVDHNGYSALSEASIAGHTIVVGQLLRALANPNSKAHDGRTPLHRAAFHGWQPVISLLLDHGADPAIRDESGQSAADLSRTPMVKKQINEFPADKTQAAKEERKRKLAERPPIPVPSLEEDQAKATPDTAARAADTGFKPPPRGRAAQEEAAKVKAETEAKAKAEAVKEKKKVAATKLKADKERREQAYKDAMQELNDMVADGQSLGESGYSIADAPRPLTARMEVAGAGDSRLNGRYQVQFATKDRVEFVKVDDEHCQVCWSSWQDEWRMFIGDYKMGSVLYRHNYRPNWKADECHGVPVDNWQKWFGKDGVPTVCVLPELGTEEAETPCEIAVETSAEVSTAQPSSPSVTAGEASSGGEKQIKKTSEFLELHSKLDIVSVDDGAERRSGAAGASFLSSSSRSKEVQLTLGGERIVETADGLFGAGEVQVEAETQPVAEVVDQDALARAWLDSTGMNPSIPATWESIVAAKGTAQELYAEQKIAEACQATTAAILALKRFEAAGGPSVSDDSVDGVLDTDGRSGAELPSEAEVESMRGVLHSNRSLLLQHQIQAGDPAVLAFGADAAWRLVVGDADVALKANPTNFKASFRRGRALLDLGELEEALQDATNVVDHYASSSSTPNPEAAALRERVLDAIKKERGKWGEKGPRRWNRGAKDLITEVSSSTVLGEEGIADKENSRKSKLAAMPWDASKPASGAEAAIAAAGQRLAAVASKPLPAPKNSSDVEKALLTTLKKEPARQVAYVREHLPMATLQRFYKRSPLGPDLLARFICISADLAEEDAQHAEDLLCALAAFPSTKTDAAMFDAEEQETLQRLTTRFGSRATEAWASDMD